MKRCFVLVIIMCLFLISCNDEVAQVTNSSGNIIQMEAYDYVGTFDNGDEIYIDEYRNNLQDAAWSMILVRDDQVIKLFSGSPSRPNFNKDRTKILYVDDVQFETIGNVTIYNSETEVETFYTDYIYGGKDSTVKEVAWYDEESVLCTIGYAMGTITQGGTLYHLNLSSKEFNLVIPPEIYEGWTNKVSEVVDFYFSDNGIDVTLLEWADDNFNDYYYTVHHIFINETNIK